MQKLNRSRIGARAFYKVAAVFVLAINFSLALPAVAQTLTFSGSGVVHAAPEPDKDKDKKQEVPELPALEVDKSCPNGQCLINKYINPAIAALSALVGVGVTTSIIYAGIQYASSADNPQKVSAARQRITTSVFVLIGYFVFYAFLDWLMPGGIIQ